MQLDLDMDSQPCVLTGRWAFARIAFGVVL